MNAGVWRLSWHSHVFCSSVNTFTEHLFVGLVRYSILRRFSNSGQQKLELCSESVGNPY